MAGSCCGSVRVLPKLDPDACNALTSSTSGLLVPETDIVGIAPGGNLGDERSVDVDVTPPVDGACPEVWTVGARLTPDWGTDDGGGVAELQPVPSGTWVDSGGAALLSEVGVYEITADFFATMTATTPWAVAIDARLFDSTNGVGVPLSTRRVQFGNINEPTNGTVMTWQNGASLSKFIEVTAPPVEIRLQGRRTHVGFNDSTAAELRYTRVGYKKIAD